ncbi:CatA-like O-acetyltransferase [Changchengzhania lutea]|uniref:CatA-like O-acetyltransferase n=1 Tax=Changchengzhania lutea TaxID=2049305 RepID=UPI00115DEB24|nr:CatA-like O-acetyltransferase [Changchengzhania lutea]
MKVLDINTWNRKAHFHHFSALSDPYFGVTIPFDVTNAYKISKKNGISFFGRYLHDCLKALNDIENFRYRIEEGKVVIYDVIHASATLMRDDNTFGFSFIDFDNDLRIFINHLESEKRRIQNSTDLYPTKNGLDCIHCSALPWLNFTGHKEPVSGEVESVPKVAFSQVTHENNRMVMNVSINVNHALVDGYHVGLFSKKFQHYLNL